MNIMGISAYFHDSACCLLRDGVLIAAAQEERFTRRKHDPALPAQAFRYCLEQGGMTVTDVNCVAYYEDPKKKLARQLCMMTNGLPWNSANWEALDTSRPVREIATVLGYEGPVKIFDHHLSHAASAFFFSGFQKSAILTVDGVGEWATTTYGRGDGKKIELFEQVDFPDSLGLLYSTLTNYLGFSVNDGEYKVMGLAPYGKPVFAEQVRTLVQLGERGQYHLDLRYFDFLRTDRMYSEQLPELFGHPPRQHGSELLQFHKDLASSLQMVLEEILLSKVEYLRSVVPSDHLCMAGGVALNCVANSRILRDGPFSKLFVQPAAGDAGGALGAAAMAHVELTGESLPCSAMAHAFWGPEFSADQIYRFLKTTACSFTDYRGREEDLLDATVTRLAKRQVIGWFQGRMEFGPRSLGARSILADPRDPTMRDRINASVKKREGFRPFAPAVLENRMDQHFDLDHPSPFMLETCNVSSKIDLPAITHVDRSARVQTVDSGTNRRFSSLLEAFNRKTGCPILLNTSFNMRDEPIVCTPLDGLVCFVRSELDALVLGDFIIDRADIAPSWPLLVAGMMEIPASAVSHHVYRLL